MKKLLRNIRSLLDKGHGLVVATIIKQIGSTPRELGTRMIVSDVGQGCGTIGGGILEAKVVAEAPIALHTGEAKSIHFQLNGKDAAESDMLCGGNVDIFLDPIPAADKNFASVIAAAEDTFQKGGRGVLFEKVSAGVYADCDPRVSNLRWLFLGEGGKQAGDYGSPELVNALRDSVPEILSNESPVLISAGILEDQADELFATPLLPPHRVILFGGGHICLHLAKLVKMMGFSLVVADDRAQFANHERFPEADEVWHSSFENMLECHCISVNDYLVIATRGHLHDLTVLQQALQTSARYVGMIGSRRKRDIIYRKLRELDVSEEVLTNVHSPIGISINAQTPEEIAVSIAAELIDERRAALKFKKTWKV